MNAVRDLRTQQRGQTSYANLACPSAPPPSVHPPVPSAAAAAACNVNAMCRKNNYGCKLRNFCAPTPSPCPCPCPCPLGKRIPCNSTPAVQRFLPAREREGGEKEGEQQHIGAALSSNVQFCCSCHAPLSRGETLVNVLATCCGNCTRTQLEAPRGKTSLAYIDIDIDKVEGERSRRRR